MFYVMVWDFGKWNVIEFTADLVLATRRLSDVLSSGNYGKMEYA